MYFVDLIYSITTGPRRRRVLLTPLTFGAAILMVFLVMAGGLWTDRRLDLPPLLPGLAGSLLGTALLLPGLAMWIWCMILFRGKSVPVNPPEHLVVTGPYAWSRNPMLTGAIVALFGFGCLSHSFAMVFIFIPAFLIVCIIELKWIEEPELRRRFEVSYDEYRRTVPMFISKKPTAEPMTHRFEHKESPL